MQEGRGGTNRLTMQLHTPGIVDHTSSAPDSENASTLSDEQRELLGLLMAEETTRRDPGAEASPLVPIQEEGAEAPIFSVGAFHFRTLAAQLGTWRPFYGLLGQNLDTEGCYLQDVEAMAARYVEVVRKAQPEGPYHLVGFCFGGLVAYEMAAQLEEAGARVGALVVAESVPADAPDMEGPPPLRERLRHHHQALRDKGVDYVATWMRRRTQFERRRIEMRGKRALSTLIDRTELETPLWLDGTQRFDQEVEAAMAYRPSPIARDLAVVIGTSTHDIPAWDAYDPVAAATRWEAFVNGEVRVTSLATNKHDDVLRLPAVDTLATVIREEVARAERHRSTSPPSTADTT